MSRIGWFWVPALLSMSGVLPGQTAMSSLNVGGGLLEQAGGLSANSPWLGAQVGYKFGGSGQLADNLLASGRILYKFDLGSEARFVLPVGGSCCRW